MPYSEKEKDEFYGSLSYSTRGAVAEAEANRIGSTAKAPCQCEECWKKEDAFAVLKIFLAFVVTFIIAWYMGWTS
jgi:hypothetical protein